MKRYEVTRDDGATVIAYDLQEAVRFKGYGVYELLDHNARCVYVGRTRSLAARLRAHRRRGWWNRISYLRWTSCDDYAEAVALESLAISSCVDELENAASTVDHLEIRSRQTLHTSAVHRLSALYAAADTEAGAAAFDSYARALYEAGWFLQAIATPLNITRERVRQRIAGAARDLDLVVPRPPAKPQPFKSRGRMPSLAEQVELCRLYKLGARLRGGHQGGHPFRVASERLSEMLAEQVMAGVPISNLADLLGVKWQTVDKRLKRYGWKFNSPSQPDYGVIHPCRRDTDAPPRVAKYRASHKGEAA